LIWRTAEIRAQSNSIAPRTRRGLVQEERETETAASRLWA
jgi:hypothetical protein